MTCRSSRLKTSWAVFCSSCSFVLAASAATAANWVISQEIRPSDGASRDAFGASLSTSGDTLAVGSPGDPSPPFDVLGAVHLYERDSEGTWLEVQKLSASDEQPGHRFGFDVALDGDLLVVGAYQDPMGSDELGAAYVFERLDGGAWVETQKLVLPDGEHSDLFGWSVAIAGGTIAVAARRDSDIGFASGSVTLYERDGTGVWVDVQKLVASDGSAFDCFGSSMALSDDELMVGATGYSRIGIGAGAVYVYQREAGGAWAEVQRIDPSNPIFAEELGWSVSFSDETAIMGAPFGNDGGALYIQERAPDGSWVEVQELVSNSTERYFGLASTFFGDTLAVGAEGDLPPENEGAAFVFSRDGDGVWADPVILDDPDQEENDFFGVDVLLYDEDELLIGDPGDHAGGSSSGAVYVYETLVCQVNPTAGATDLAIGIDCAIKKLNRL